MIPQTFIDDLLCQTNIVEFIDSYVPLKKRGTSHLACCPFHQEKNPSFNVIEKKQFYHCFGCGVSGNAISFAMEYLHLSFPEAIKTLALRAGLQIPREDEPHKQPVQNNLYQLLLRIAQDYQKNLHLKDGAVALDYVTHRGVSLEIAQRYQLGYAPQGWHHLEAKYRSSHTDLINTGMIIAKEDGKTYDRYRHRLMFPIHDRHGRIIGFGGRALDNEDKPKYLNSPETALFQKNRELYGLHHVLKHCEKIDSMIIVEGYMDVIALAQHGILNAVATLGTATSTYHLQLLSKHTKHLIFCFDGDTAGEKAAWRALENSLTELHTDITPCFVFLPQGHDPDSLIREEGVHAFRERLNHATPLHTYFLNTLMRDIDHSTLAGKSQLITKAKPYFKNIADGPYKQLMLEELARVTHIESHRIDQLITQTSPDKPAHTSTTIIRTPLRLATALLLQHPEIYAQCTQSFDPSSLDATKHHVLQELIQYIQKNPKLTTAMLIELWRTSDLFESIIKLAAWEHGVPAHALVQEFTDIILFLIKQTQECYIQQCIEKSRHQQLTPTERQALLAMLQQRHIQSHVKDRV